MRWRSIDVNGNRWCGGRGWMTGSSLVALALSREGAIHRTISSYFPPSFKWQDGRLSLESFLKCPLFYYPSTGSRGMLGLLLEQVRQMRNCHHHHHPCSLVGNTWYHLKSSCLIYIFSASLSYLSWGEKKNSFSNTVQRSELDAVSLSLLPKWFSPPPSLYPSKTRKHETYPL